MVESKNKYISTIIFSIIILILVPLISWIFEIFNNELNISFSSIHKIHQYNKILYFIDLFIIFFGIYLIYHFRNYYKTSKYFINEIKHRDDSISRIASFTKNIGEGNYDIVIESDGKEDVLTESLILMRDNLKKNKIKESEQNWIAEGKDVISNILRIKNNIDELAYEVIVALIKYINVVQGAIYLYEEKTDTLVNKATYAYNRNKYVNQEFKVGVGLIGQCAYEKDIVYRTEIPEDYTTITSGILGDKKPCSLIIVPLITDEKLQGVMEFTSIKEEIPETTIAFLTELGEIIARTIYNLRINQKTERLLKESQQMTEELRENEEELRQNAEEMRSTHEELEKSNEKLEAQILEVEKAQKRLYSLLENASEVISIYDEELNLKYVSPSVNKIYGYNPEEMMKGKDMDRLTRKGEAELREMFKKLLENPQTPQNLQYTYMKKDGKKIFLETIGRNLLDDPAIHGIILNSQDITARKRAEKEERMRSKMQALSENSMDMILRINPTGQFFYANPVVEKYLGYQSKDLMNKTLSQIDLNEPLQNYFKETINEIKYSLNKSTKEITIPTIFLGERILSIDAIPEFNENELETILFVNHDITEAKMIELDIQDKNRKITESINYAQRIQSSILPTSKLLQEHLPKSFILYKARDVVSGDFPWFFKRGDNIYVAAVDCTGHGVPGALLSFIAYFSLNNVVDHDIELTAGQICDKLHHTVRHTLKQDKVDADARDGMDIALCKINLKKKEVQYAGAHRPLFMIRGKEFSEYKGDRKAIGGIPHRKKVEQDFTNHKIIIKQGDKIFFFSDGITDQVGGPLEKKYSPARIRDIIIEHNNYSMPKFANYFAKDFTDWKKDNKQIDDVLLIGIEF
ncbi:MAG: PAS domain S-box protein [Bacteroidales bacterium]|nr:PAS domain S-box protein [Bacteroidales bacterium]